MSKLKFKDSSFFKSLLNKKYMVFLSNFVFQGMRYMTIGELIFKVSFTFVFAVFFYLVLDSFLLAIFLGHVANFALNGQFFVLARYLFSSDAISTDELSEFIDIIDRSYKWFGVEDVLIIGSFCRVEMGRTSDLDLRILHNSDIMSSTKAYLYAFFLRFISMFKKFPMDVYCFSSLSFLNKIREDEFPSYFLGVEKYRTKYPMARNVKLVLKENVERWKC